MSIDGRMNGSGKESGLSRILTTVDARVKMFFMSSILGSTGTQRIMKTYKAMMSGGDYKGARDLAHDKKLQGSLKAYPEIVNGSPLPEMEKTRRVEEPDMLYGRLLQRGDYFAAMEVAVHHGLSAKAVDYARGKHVEQSLEAGYARPSESAAD